MHCSDNSIRELLAEQERPSGSDSKRMQDLRRAYEELRDDYEVCAQPCD